MNHKQVGFMRLQVSNLVGIGLYAIPEAARLTKIPKRNVRRWLRGYSTRYQGAPRRVPPVLDGQVPVIGDTVGLGFLDLLEIRFVHAFRQFGVSLPVIRSAAQSAREIFQQDHPFARKRFKTDGRRIFAEILEASAETKLLDLTKSQYAFHRVIMPTLYASVEYSELDEALRWYPMWPKQQVLLDPKRCFGRPIVAQGGVPTETLAVAVESEGSAERVARWFGVPRAAVQAALEFELEIAA